MTEEDSQKNNESAAVGVESGTTGGPVKRGEDFGDALLPQLEHFVTLVRHLQQPRLLVDFFEVCASVQLPDAISAVLNASTKALIPKQRTQIYRWTASQDSQVLLNLARASERIDLLCDNRGAVAVDVLLDDNEIARLCNRRSAPARHDRALYLYLEHLRGAGGQFKPSRFEHAEARLALMQQIYNERHSCHFVCNPDGLIESTEQVRSRLKSAVMEVCGQSNPDDLVVEIFAHHAGVVDDAPIELCTVNVKFNGSSVHYEKIQAGSAVYIDDRSVCKVRFSWERKTGALSVTSDDPSQLMSLAHAFRSAFFGTDADLQSPKMCQVNLDAFKSKDVLHNIKVNRIDGIEGIEIRSITVGKPRLLQRIVRGRATERVLTNPLIICRHTEESRDIYQVAVEEHKRIDLNEYDVAKVNLCVRVAGNRHRRAHNVLVDLKKPSGFTDADRTKEDRDLIVQQFEQLQWLHMG